MSFDTILTRLIRRPTVRIVDRSGPFRTACTTRRNRRCFELMPQQNAGDAQVEVAMATVLRRPCWRSAKAYDPSGWNPAYGGPLPYEEAAARAVSQSGPGARVATHVYPDDPVLWPLVRPFGPTCGGPAHPVSGCRPLLFAPTPLDPRDVRHRRVIEEMGGRVEFGGRSVGLFSGLLARVVALAKTRWASRR